MEYMVNSAISHEYAHALLFKLNRYNLKNDGHSSQWKQTCIKLGGDDCQQYLNKDKIIVSKMPSQ